MQQLALGYDIEHGAAADTVLITMAAEELALALDAITTVRREIEREGFSTRLGGDERQADALRSVLRAVAAKDELAARRRGAAEAQRLGRSVVAVSRADLVLINNALNEVLNGLSIDEGALPPGPHRHRAEALLKAVRAIVAAVPATAEARTGVVRPYVDGMRSSLGADRWHNELDALVWPIDARRGCHS